MLSRLIRFWQDESGATAIEYGFILALIVIGIIGSITAIGGAISTAITNAANDIR